MITELTEKQEREIFNGVHKTIKKRLFESNNTHRFYLLIKIMPNGKEEYFKYFNKAGEITYSWYEQLINGKWQRVEYFPPIINELTESEKLEYSIDIKKNIQKNISESNKKYKTYWLSEIIPGGTKNHFYYVNKKGRTTPYWHEQFINDEWQHIDCIPPDAYLKLVASIENDNIVFNNKCTQEERNIIASSLAFALEA